MSKRTTTKTVSLYGMAGEGAGIRSALADATNKLEKLIADLQKPNVVVAVGAESAILVRTLDGWGYIRLTGADGIKRGAVWPTFSDGNDEREATLCRMVAHLAHGAWTPEVPDDDAFITKAARDNQIPSRCIRDLATEFTSWAKFQRRYAAAVAAGHGQDMAWRIAMGDPSLPAEQRSTATSD